MKTNQVMLRDEYFVQRTADGYFNATVLIENYNKNRDTNKKLGNYNKNDSTREYIEQLKHEGVEKPIVSSRGQGKNSGTWMHPKLFIDFAMWVSVEFKSKVIDYVLDGLIKYRHDAGDFYNEMSAQILETYINYYGRKPNPAIYINEANMIKSLLGLEGIDRNELTEKDLNNITILQRVNTTLLKKNTGRTKRINNLKVIAESL